MLMYLGDGSAQTIVCFATLRQKLKIKLFYLTLSQYTDTDQPVPALTL